MCKLSLQYHQDEQHTIYRAKPVPGSAHLISLVSVARSKSVDENMCKITIEKYIDSKWQHFDDQIPQYVCWNTIWQAICIEDGYWEHLEKQERGAPVFVIVQIRLNLL